MTVATVLAQGKLTVLGRLAGSSNATLLSMVTDAHGHEIKCVYKPVTGERPLWDFPDGTLAGREVAAYELSRLLNWDVIPVTVWRDDGPYGEGSVQLWVDTDEDICLVDLISVDVGHEGWLHVLTGENEAGQEVRVVHRDRFDLAQIALLDALMNNADRKAGHLLIGEGDRLWGIDHGLTFNEQPKLRTVLWGWAGHQIPEPMMADMASLVARWNEVERVLETFLAGYELRALAERLQELSDGARYPRPPEHWPAVPWPLF
jgi:uncharacterized repeat protein (TIGR03843 family)